MELTPLDFIFIGLIGVLLVLAAIVVVRVFSEMGRKQ